MRRYLRGLILNFITFITRNITSRPDKVRIHESLSRLYRSILEEPGKDGLLIDVTDPHARIIILSDQHKGTRNGADDFRYAAETYLTALNYYNAEKFMLVNLGDAEELWENQLSGILKANEAIFEKERQFAERNAYVKLFGNHDLYWSMDVSGELQKIFSEDFKAHEGAVLKFTRNGRSLNMLCAHGHQGDSFSDGSRFSKFLVAYVWAPLQALFKIYPNLPSNNYLRKSIHNLILYDWSAMQKHTVVVSGHTHQPVFRSFTHIERLHSQWRLAVKLDVKPAIDHSWDKLKPYKRRLKRFPQDYSSVLPTYFNTGCCCYANGSITGIEINGDIMRLVKWKKTHEGVPERLVLDETLISKIINELHALQQ